MTDREIMQQALEALVLLTQAPTETALDYADNAIDALRERLAQPEQEPVAWMHNHIEGNVITHRPADLDRHPDRWTALYTAPPQRKKLPPQTPCLLTQAENKMFRFGWLECEAAHGIKGEA